MLGLNLDTILELLERQKKTHEELLGLSYEKRQAIVKSDTGRLNEIVHQELKGLAKMNQHEKRRSALLKDISRTLGIGESEITLSMIIGKADGEKRDRLIALQKELIELLNSQAEINKQNQELLKLQLDYSDVMLNVFVGSDDPLNNFYSDNGRSGDDKRQSAGLFDRQV